MAVVDVPVIIDPRTLNTAVVLASWWFVLNLDDDSPLIFGDDEGN